MHNKLLAALSLIAGQAMAMELTIDDKQAMPNEKKVVITIQGQERELPARFIPLIGTLDLLSKEGTSLQMSPITLVSFDTWQLIENQLERVYAITHGNKQMRNDIIADYSQLDSMSFIDLIKVVDYLDIALLKEITLKLAQKKLTSDEILELPELLRNEVIIRKSIKIAIVDPGLVKELAVCRGHENIVSSVCVTTDDKIVSGSYDNTVRIWAMNGQELVVCRGHEGTVWSVCVTSDGKIVSGSEDKTVRIWDMNGQQLEVFRGHEGAVCTVCVTPDGKIVSGSADKTVRIWDMNGKELAVCRGHEKEITSVWVTSDGGKIVSGSRDKTVRIWDMNGNQLAVCKGHERRITSVCTHDGKIVSGSWDGTVRIWDMNGRELAFCLGSVDEGVISVGISPDGKIVSGSDEKTVRIWDMNGQQLAFCMAHDMLSYYFKSVCEAPDGKIFWGSSHHTVHVGDISLVFGLLYRLSVMSKEQAKLIIKTLEYTMNLLKIFFGEWGYGSHYARNPGGGLEKMGNSYSDAYDCISKGFWQEIEKILAKEELVVELKKRKELENSENNPGKRLRLLEEEELVNENI